MSGNVSSSALLEPNNSSARKRKRCEGEHEELDNRPFSIRDADHPFARPKRFLPVCLITRAQLPLACLDTAQDGSRLFTARIPLLEDSTWHRRHEPVVLVAEEEQEKKLCAVERVGHGTYALCSLRKDVGKHLLLHLTAQDNEAIYHHVEDDEKLPTGGHWWARAGTDMPRAEETPSAIHEMPRLKMRRVMTEPQKGAAAAVKSDAALQPAAYLNPTNDFDLPVSQAIPEEVLRELAEHYMESLYVERTSLAYFTKGPLSRARAAFSDATPHDLVNFLRQSILPSATMDKKYRESIVDIVKKLPIKPPEIIEDKSNIKKKPKKWKPKRSRDGFFIQEKEYVKRWWWHEDAASSLQTVDAMLRSKLSKVRIRETFLQLILCMEVLALEASAEYLETTFKGSSLDADTQATDIIATESQPLQQMTKSKAKKKQDLPVLLDTMLDKLCIWHSLESQSPAKARTGESLESEDTSNDGLRIFCVEVVLPFYLPRIPNFASLVNKKLGGPTALSPIKRKPSSNRKPGQPASRHAPGSNTRQPLARVSTDALNRSAKSRPSLHRSATDSRAMLQVKREGTETPPLLNLIPLSSETQPTRRARPSSLQHRSSSNASMRVMDLSAMAQASEAKLRKKTERADMIKEAVEGIKKPNRELAVKDTQCRTDEIFAKAVAKGSRIQQQHKSRTPGGKADHTTKIATTPAAGAKRTSAAYHNDPAGFEHHPTDHPASSAWIVPSSSARLRAPAQASETLPDPTMEPPEPNSAFAVPQTGHRPRHFSVHPHTTSLPTPSKPPTVQDTPSRGFARFMPRGLASQPGVLPALGQSPVATRTLSAANVPSTPVRAFTLSDKHEETPIKKLDVATRGLTDTPLHGGLECAAAGGERSIYAALGWDD